MMPTPSGGEVEKQYTCRLTNAWNHQLAGEGQPERRIETACICSKEPQWLRMGTACICSKEPQWLRMLKKKKKKKQAARKLFVIIVISQVAVLLAYFVFGKLYMNVPTWELMSSEEMSVFSRGVRRKPLENVQIQRPFQQIDHQQAWMYSAHFDYVSAQQGHPTVRIFGIVQRNLLTTVYCNLNIEGGSVISAKAIETPESHNVSFPTSYIECRLPANTRPTHVSVSFQRNNTSTNRFEIIDPGARSRNFTVCYSVLHSGYNSASQLIQSIEMNRILGAEHFMVYNCSISPAVDQILRRYQQDGLVTVLPWPVPVIETWYYGQMTALNDCFYRNRNISRFVVVVDTDEFIIPQKHSSWMEVLHETSPKEYDVSSFLHPSAPHEKDMNTTGCFVVMSSYFTTSSSTNWASLPSQFPFSEEEKKNTLKYKIFLLSQFLRDTEIFKPNERSKYIARPELAYDSGIHFVHNFTSAAECMVVSNNISLVHHHRLLTIERGVVDTSVLRFKSQLYPRVMEKYKLFSEIFI